MKLYTKTGDNGSTSLVGGTRVSKTHKRVNAYGDIDELISWIGLLRCECPVEKSSLLRIEEVLMQVSARLACIGETAKIKQIEDAEIEFLEKEIDRLSAQLPPQNAFVLPGASRNSSLCHIARTVCRRAERSIVAIDDRCSQDDTAMHYVNRLSDYLFALARKMCLESDCKEDFWLP